MSAADLDCAFVDTDARVHAIARASDKPQALCGNDDLTVRVDYEQSVRYGLNQAPERADVIQRLLFVCHFGPQS